MDLDLWGRWEDHYRQIGLEPSSICRDGILDDSSFKTASRKILFVLREVNNWASGDLTSFFTDGPKYPIWYAVARWAAGLLEGFPPISTIEEPEKLKKSLKSVAAINLKKATGGAQADPLTISLFAHQDRQLLREQIEAIEPEIIVACGTFEPLVWLLDLNMKGNWTKEPVKFAEKGKQVVVNWRHPARASRSSYDELQRTWATIHARL